MKKTFSRMNIGFFSMGNGITVYHTTKQTSIKIAHISADRKIKYYQGLPKDVLQMIEDYRNTMNPTISTSQTDQFVFKEKV